MALPAIPLDFGDTFENAFAKTASARHYMQATRSAERADQRKAEAQQYVEPALKGDSAAMGKLAYGDPQAAVAVTTALTRMDANQRAQTKEQAEYAAHSANAVLQSDPAERPAVYRQMYDMGVQRGYKMVLPPDYNPSLDGQLRAYRHAAVPIVEWFKQNEGTPQPMGGAAPAGGAPAAPGASPGGGGPYGGAIAGIESSGAPNGGYGAVGPAADSKGSRAYGKYQVMDFNIGPWTQEALGKPMTPQEFLANPQAQDAVFNAKFGQYVQKYGSPQAAARAWFAGEGGMNNPGASDVLGTTVANYERKFTSALGNTGAAAPGVPGPVAAPLAQMPVAQGGGDGSGNPQAPADPRSAIRGIQLPPGARIMGVKGVPVVKDGTVMVMMPDGSYDFVPLPQRKEPGNTAPPGPFGGNGMDAQALNIVLRGDPASPEYAAAYSHLSRGHTTINDEGKPVTVQPMDLSAFRKPAFSLNGQAAPGGAPGAPSSPGGPSVTVGAPIPGAAKAPNNEQALAAGFADRMANSNGIVAGVENQGKSGGGRFKEAIPFGMGNFAQSPEYQSFKQARDDFINAQLRRESGAAISPAEYANADKQYFPVPGDGPDVIKQKALNRQIVVEAMVKNAGPSYKPRGSGGPASDKPLTPEEAAKLPPGTKFIGTDGVERTRH